MRKTLFVFSSHVYAPLVMRDRRFVAQLRIACMYIIRYRTLLLRSYFCKKKKVRVKAKTVLKRWTVCSSNHYHVRLFYFLLLAGGRKKKIQWAVNRMWRSV